MKQRLIDANAVNVSHTIGGMNDFADCIKEAVQATLDNASTVLFIPENPTNGDIIKAMFPNAKTWEIIVVNITYVCVAFEGMIEIKKFTLDWWNAPYKKGE